MPPSTKPEQRETPRDASVEETTLSTPDEAGPRDVPDREVIEKTLPTKPVEKPGG
jgi:hypothetical protein